MRSVILIMMLGFAGCSDGDAVPQDDPKPVPAPEEATKRMFSCPMHPNQTSNEPGKCPKCSMDLVEVKEHDHSDHDH